MIAAIALLLTCQLLGEAIRLATGLPVPGAVVGMLLLLLWLALIPRERPTLTAVTGWLTAHLSIMFVPAAVGVMQEGGILARWGWALVLATVLSTLMTMIVTALAFRWAALRWAGPSA